MTVPTSAPIRRPSRVRRLTRAACLLLLLLLALPADAQISAEEYARRRAGLMENLGDGLYYFEGATAGSEYDVRGQESNFYYLTGIDEPEARLLLTKSGEEVREVLFVLERDVQREIWDGHRLGPEGAAAVTGMEARALDELDAVLSQASRVGYAALVSILSPTGNDTVADLFESMSRMSARRPGARGGSGAADGARGGGASAGSGGGREGNGTGAAGVTWIDPTPTLHRMRSIKSAAEIELLQTASTITRQAHEAAMQAAEPGMNEFEIEALIEYFFRRNGAARPGFDSIVGSGPNSTVLHYNRDDRFMESGETMVMDIGAEYMRYTTDVTRTVPVSGKFTAQQREIYDIVLAAQLAAEEVAREIGASQRDLSDAANKVIAEGLAELGLIESAEATLPGSNRPQYSLFYLHGLGHGIGLDVHDPNSPTIEVGYAFTIEPGLYIREDALDRIGEGPEADALRAKLRGKILEYKDIGVRIEDSYAYTETGLVRLSEGVPRTPDEVEAMMAEDSFSGAMRLEELVERFRKRQREQR